MHTASSFDFGYPWWLSYGHLPILAVAIIVVLLARLRRWPMAMVVVPGLIAAWAAAAFVMVRAFDANGVPALPTPAFLQSGVGRVLDLGAGTGRSSIMVLRERPRATLVATDLFGESFVLHFGTDTRPQARLLANLEAAGVAGRASIETADMRALPYESSSFEALVSAYAMDHLGKNGAMQALAEAARVIRPGGDFLLILVASDGWTTFAFGPLLAHGRLRGADWWRARATEAAFTVVEEGRRPATLYFLLRR